MSTSVTLPALGESVTEGTVSRWLKQVGDTVEADEPLLEVSTDKVDTEIPSPASGVLLEIKAQEDETVEVGAVLAVIGEPSEADGQPAAAPETPSEEAAEAPAQEEAQRRRKPSRRKPSSRSPRRSPRRPEGGAEAAAETAAPAASSGGPATGTDVTLARTRRERDRGNGKSLAQAGWRFGGGRRAAAGGLDGQGRHRNPFADFRHIVGDTCPGRRDGRSWSSSCDHRGGRSRCAAVT